MPAIVERMVEGELSSQVMVPPGGLTLVEGYDELDGSENAIVVVCDHEDENSFVFDLSILEEGDINRDLDEFLSDADPLDIISVGHEGEYTTTAKSPAGKVMQLQVVHRMLMSSS